MSSGKDMRQRLQVKEMVDSIDKLVSEHNDLDWKGCKDSLNKALSDVAVLEKDVSELLIQVRSLLS